MNRFITEKEVEEAKERRAEEWRKAREAGRELPEEKEEVKDFRSLYEKLKEQKDLKQEEFEDKLKFKNMIYKGLNEDDAQFLSMVAEKQAKIDGKRFEDETGEIAEYKAAVEKVHSIEDEEKGNPSKSKLPTEYISKKKSQASLVASAIIRKRKSSSTPDEDTLEKQRKTSEGDDTELKTEGKEQMASNSLQLVADYPSSSSDEDEDDT